MNVDESDDKDLEVDNNETADEQSQDATAEDVTIAAVTQTKVEAESEPKVKSIEIKSSSNTILSYRDQDLANLYVSQYGWI